MSYEVDYDRLVGALGASALTAGSGGDAWGTIGTGLLWYSGALDEAEEEPSLFGDVPWYVWAGGAVGLVALVAALVRK